ncbi:MAG: PaeR7I family type II restriction endonuclease [Polyangiales bacterium]
MIDLDERFRAAVESFWQTREVQAKNQARRGRVDAGTRGAVTGGAQMAAIESLIVQLLCEVGLRPDELRTGSSLDLPGFFRPEKRWDLLVIADRTLVAAIEFKSQVGSIGNNFNNRTEEALGNSVDLWTAFREGRFGVPTPPEPFLGFFFLLEDTLAVHRPVRPAESHFAVDPIFKVGRDGVSYARRYEILLQRLVAERKYSAGCLTLSSRGARGRGATVEHPSADLSFKRFAASLQGHAVTFLRSR